MEAASVGQWRVRVCRHMTKTTTELSSTGHQPLKSQYLPHLAHHHHFGWNLPTPEVVGAARRSRA